MGLFNTIKFKFIEGFILFVGYTKKSQEGSHIKYEINNKSLIIPKHKEIFRGTLNNIFKIIALHLGKNKKDIEFMFLRYYKK